LPGVLNATNPQVENFSFKCPECGLVSDNCLSGQELLLVSLEGEKGD